MGDKRLSELERATSFANTDLLWVTTDPDGTPQSKALTKEVLFEDVECDAHFSGNTTITELNIANTSAATAPSDTSTPVAWLEIIVGGVTYKVGLFQ